MKTYAAKHISISVERSFEDVYEYASNPLNLPNWAAGLSESEILKEGDFWTSESPMGKVKIQFAPKNGLGVMDHDVTLPSGEVNHNAFRVVPNHKGSEVTFVLLRLPRMSDEDFSTDAGRIEADLKTLKKILEKGDS